MRPYGAAGALVWTCCALAACHGASVTPQTPAPSVLQALADKEKQAPVALENATRIHREALNRAESDASSSNAESVR